MTVSILENATKETHKKMNGEHGTNDSSTDYFTK